MRKQALIRAAACAGAIQLGLSAPLSVAALPPDWKPELLASATDVRTPTEPIRLSIRGLKKQDLKQLGIELDDMDVTATVTVENNVAVITPSQPLDWGQHQLRLVEYAPDGDIVERGLWILEVRKSEAFREANFRANATLNLVRRVSDKNLGDSPGKSQADGSAALAGGLADGSWRATGQMDLLYNSQENQMPRGNDKVDMGQFLLTGETGRFTAKAGHHTVGTDSMIMQNFNSRGVSGGYQSEDTGTSVNVFSLRTQNVTGFQEGFGIGDSDNRVDGVTVSGRPITSRRDALVVSAAHLFGADPGQTGEGVGGDSLTTTEGRASSVVADGNLLDKRLRLRAEYASSDFDFDGPNTGSPAEHDQAYSALISYTPWHDKVVRDKPMAWNLGLEHKRIGTFFRSPANPQGVADRDLIRGFTGFNWSGLDLQASIATETDNVNDLALLPRIETLQTVWSLSYTPEQDLALMEPDGQVPKMPWYGQPFYNIGYFTLDQDVEKAGAGLSAGAFHATDNVTLSATFSYSTWSWAISHGVGKDEDFTNAASDTESELTDVSANIQIGRKLSLTPTIQHNEINDKDNHITATTDTGGLSLTYTFTEKVAGSFGFTINREEASDGSVNSKTTDLTGHISWTVAEARAHRPGLALSLEGQRHEQRDPVNLSSDTESYQIFLKAIVSWQPS